VEVYACVCVCVRACASVHARNKYPDINRTHGFSFKGSVGGRVLCVWAIMIAGSSMCMHASEAYSGAAAHAVELITREGCAVPIASWKKTTFAPQPLEEQGRTELYKSISRWAGGRFDVNQPDLAKLQM